MSILKKKKITTSELVWMAMFTAVLAVCAWISIPMPIPFTLQTFGVFLTMCVLGGRMGTLVILNYLCLGLIGLPVFSGFRGGAAVFFGNTGGYVIGFLFSALIMWLMESLLGKKKYVRIFSMAVGLLGCYVFGTFWFMFLYMNRIEPIGIWSALCWCVFPYVIPDALKIGLAFVISQRISNMK